MIGQLPLSGRAGVSGQTDPEDMAGFAAILLAGGGPGDITGLPCA